MSHISNLEQDIVRSYEAGFAARLYVGSEIQQYQQAALRAAAVVNTNRPDQKCRVVCWNRLCGFYVGTPSTLPPVDKATNQALIAFSLMINTKAQTADATGTGRIPSSVKLPFKETENIIFLVNEIDMVMAEASGMGPLVTMIRSFISNLLNTPVVSENEDDSRGKRMFVLLSTHKDISKFLPELSPATVALPDDIATGEAIDTVFRPLNNKYEEDKTQGVAPLTDKQVNTLVHALRGMPYQSREDALSLAANAIRGCLGSNREIVDMDPILEVIENEQSRYVSGIPGITYTPKSSVFFKSLPGYETVDEFIAANMASQEIAKRGLPPMKGILLIGPPGTGKSEFSRTVARKLGRMMLTISLGEIQGGIVGATEANMRRVVDVTRDRPACVFIDELDKQGASSMESGHSGDGGVFSRLLSMLLTEMTDPRNETVWIFAANRMISADGRVLLPAPLIRAGRIDEKYIVDLPDSPIRKAIMKVHMDRYKVQLHDNDLKVLAGETDGWVGAELHDLVVRAGRLAAQKSTDILDFNWMMARIKSTEPQSSQEEFAKEWAANRKACQGFTTVGRSATASSGKSTAPKERARAI